MQVGLGQLKTIYLLKDLASHIVSLANLNM